MVVVCLRRGDGVDGAVTSTATDERCAASCRPRYACVQRLAPRARDHRCVRRYIARGVSVSVLAMSCLGAIRGARGFRTSDCCGIGVLEDAA